MWLTEKTVPGDTSPIDLLHIEISLFLQAGGHLNIIEIIVQEIWVHFLQLFAMKNVSEKYNKNNKSR